MKNTLLGGVKNKAKKLIKQTREYLTKERIIALSMLSRVIGMVLLVSIIPIGTVSVNAKDTVQDKLTKTDSKVVLDVHSSVPANLPEIQSINVEMGESNFNKTQREEAEKQALEAQRDVLEREIDRYEVTTVTVVDPSLDEKRALVQQAAAAYGIDWKILEAVWQVESGKQWITTVSSYAGAQGPMQFMPATWSAYGVDGNGDGIADINNAEDALYGGANYLAANGLASGDVYSALFHYNHADWYVQKVIGIANSI